MGCRGAELDGGKEAEQHGQEASVASTKQGRLHVAEQREDFNIE